MSDSKEQAGFVAPDPADLAPLFPGYEIECLIATGGMGAVYRAVQKSLERTVALKILPVEFSKDKSFCASFEAEAKAMARLNHPNLIGVYDFGEVNGMLFIIMEFVPGKSIYHSAYGRTIEPKEVIRLVTGVCNGLAHAHENGIIHRDIKPSNILLDLNAEPKIGDFGLAGPMGRSIEEGDEIFGTPHYTAPEVVNSPRSVDFRADIFSVGVLLHELLTSRLPAEDPRSASAIVRCDTRFDAIIRKATQPLPAGRYSSAREIAKDLQEISGTDVAKVVPKLKGPKVGRAPVVARHRPAGPRRGYTRPVARSSSSGAGAIAFLIAAAVAAIAAYLLFMRNPPEEPSGPGVTILPAGSEKASSESGSSSERSWPTQPPSGSRKSKVDSTEGEQDREDTASNRQEVPDVRDDEAVSSGSEFDVPAFFDRAREAMLDRAKAPIAAYKLGMKENFNGFENSLKREEFKYKTGDGPGKRALENAIKGWKSDGVSIPDDLDEPLSDFPEMKQVHAEYQIKERGVRDIFNLAISKLSFQYVVGLEKEIERRKADNDPASVELIKKQIDRSKSDSDYFPSSILGLSEEDLK